MALQSLEDELDAALADLEFEDDDDQKPSANSDDDTSSTRSPSKNQPVSMSDIDFSGGANADNDGFEEARQFERANTLVATPPSSPAGYEQTETAAARYLDTELPQSHRKQTPSSNNSRNIRIGVLVLGAIIVAVLTSNSTPGGAIAGVVTQLGYTGASTSTAMAGVCSSKPCFKPDACDSGTWSHARVWSQEDSKPRPQGSTAVLIVGHAPSRVTIDRILEMADACRASDLPIDLWVSLDNTFRHNSTHTLIMELESHALRLILGRDVKLHEYSGEQVHSRYPALHQLPYCRKNSNKMSLINTDKCPHQSTTQIESIMLWWKHERVAEVNYQTVWVLDDDVGFSGNFAKFVEKHSANSADLLSYNGCVAASETKLPEKLAPTGALTSLQSKAFTSFVKEGHPVLFSEEQVQRYSSQLLNELNECSLKGVVADRRTAVCTVCRAAGLETAAFSPDSVSSHFSIDSKQALTKDEFLSKATAEKDTFFHPLLF
eukprot:m.98164 g.98164  ORF g.98164 m.98164 type:complete len:491 (+) comp27040_c1_seq2:161-1633(+)